MRRMHSGFLRGWAAHAAAGLAMAASVHAATQTWNAAAGAWSDPANWNPGPAPAANDTLIFDAAGDGGANTNDLSGLRAAGFIVSNYAHTVALGGQAFTCSSFVVHGIGVTTATLALAGSGELAVPSIFMVAAGDGVSGGGADGPRLGGAVTNGIAFVTLGSNASLRVGSPAAGARMRIGYQNGATFAPSHVGSVTAGRGFNAYLSTLEIGRRSMGTSASSNLFGVLDLSAVTDPGVLQVTNGLYVGGNGSAGALVLSDALDLKIGLSPSARAPLLIKNERPGFTAMSLGAGRLEAYLTTLDLGNTVGGDNYLRAARAAGFLDIAGNVTVGKQPATSWRPNVEVTLGDGIAVRIGSPAARAAFDFAWTAGAHETNTFRVGTNRFEAYLSRLTAGLSSRNSTLSGEKSYVTLDLGRVSSGVLDISGGYTQGVNAAIVSSVVLSDGFATTIGAPAVRATMTIGGGVRWLTNTFSAGGSFSAYLSELAVGGSSLDYMIGVTNETVLDLARVTNGTLDVSGDMIVGALGAVRPGGGTGSWSRGTVILPSIRAQAGRLFVGCTNTGARGVLVLTGTVFTVTNSVRIDGPPEGDRGQIRISVVGRPAGLDMGPAATLAVSRGEVRIRFEAPPRSASVYWGLRWAGDHVAELAALTNASPSKLIWDDAGLGPSAGKVGIFATGGYTYVGLAARRGLITEVR